MGKRSSRKKRNKKTPIKINPIVKQILIGVATGTLVHNVLARMGLVGDKSLSKKNNTRTHSSKDVN